jgi:DNA-binding response OmpR family regulator
MALCLLYYARFKITRFKINPERNFMTRVLMIDGNHLLTAAVGMQCFEQGIAVRMASDFCDGLRQILDTPVSLVIVSSSLVHLSGAELAKLFDTIAPGVPVVIRVEAGQTMDEQVRFELHGFRVVREPFDVLDLMVKGERPARRAAPNPAVAAATVEAACR